MPVHWFCSPCTHQFAQVSSGNNHCDLANPCETGSFPPESKIHAYLHPPGWTPPTQMLGYHVLQGKRLCLFSLAHLRGSRWSYYFFFNPRSNASEKGYFTECTENLFSKMFTDAIYDLDESTPLQLHYEPLSSEPQWIFPNISCTYYYALLILGARLFCSLQLYCQQTMPIRCISVAHINRGKIY